MSSDVVLVLLSVATAFVFISSHSTYKETVHCSCGSKTKKFTICAQQNTRAADPCTQWPGCKSFQGSSEGLSRLTATDPNLRSGRKKKCASHSRVRWHSYPSKPVRSRPQSENCGRSITKKAEVYSILGTNGVVAPAGEWPWVVSIKENNESEIVCGGALLNSRTVVTAAHCLTGSNSYILYFGKIRKLDKDDDDKVVVRTSNRIIIHPYYSDTTLDSDIALIHFSNPIRFTDRISPISLPNTLSTAKNLRSGRMGFVAGFGLNERAVQPNNLMQFSLPVQDNKVCVEYYKEQGITLIMSQNMFCMGYDDAYQATCEGDSGSALVFLDQSTQVYTLEGLVSFATNGQCGTFGKYIVFTKVFPYVPWLLANLA